MVPQVHIPISRIQTFKANKQDILRNKTFKFHENLVLEFNDMIVNTAM
jgi:hypothetical protein